jgi:DNA-binding winged helix-turn-helix (wHTH) protein
MGADRFSFGPFELDLRARRVLRNGEAVPIENRHFDLLCTLVAHAGEVLSKDRLIDAVWADVAVTDNSLERAISNLRRLLATPDGAPIIETHVGRGYRFARPVTRLGPRAGDEALDALLAPHRAWLEGRAALETLNASQIVHARRVFERVVADVPDYAPAHVGLANACVLQFETTRADAAPDHATIERAIEHAREACRLDPQSGEAWATLGFVLDRAGRRPDAIASARRATALEPDNWRHHLRLAYAGWGEERLAASRRTLALVPGLALAHWLAASVYVARQALAEADRELAAARASMGSSPARFGAVAVHWLWGLVALARGDQAAALAAFEEELAHEADGHLYARECCAQTWYAIGAVRLRRGEVQPAVAAMREAIARLPTHPGALATVAALVPADPALALGVAGSGAAAAAWRAASFDAALGDAVRATLGGRKPDAAALVDDCIRAAPEGSTGWILPVEPLLRPYEDSSVWAAALARLRGRAV